MTKSFLCDKINVMNKHLNIKNKIVIVSILFALLISCIAGTFGLSNIGFADTNAITVNKFLPETELEYKSLSSPIDVYSDENVTAIAKGTQELLIYMNGSYKSIPASLTFSAIKQVKKLNDTTLIVSDGGIVYSINLANLENQGAQVKAQLFDKNSDPVGGNFFDINGDFLVTSFSTTANVYVRSGDEFESPTFFTVRDNSPIAINALNQIFYVDGQGICSRNTSAMLEGTVLVQNAFPDKMIADDQFVYYILDSKIYRVSVSGGSPVQLQVSVLDGAYDLGNFSSPNGISFRGKNLLITDSDSVQEYKVEEDKLVFTGFAVAQGKTAFNRVNGKTSGAIIRKYDDKIAVADDFKLTVINTDGTGYERENYSNFVYPYDGVITKTPTDFALGKTSILLTYDGGTVNCKLYLLDLTTGKVGAPISISSYPNVRSVCYQQGYYFILTDNGSAFSRVYKVSESDFNISDDNLVFEAQTAISARLLGVNARQDLVLSDKTTWVSVYKKDNLSINATYEQAYEITGLTQVSCVQSDLGDGVYVLDSGSIKYFSNGTLKDTFTVNGINISSFAMDFISDSVYMLSSDVEYISVCSDMDNISLAKLEVPNDFILRKQTTTHTDLKSYSVANGLCCYEVELANATDFKFKKVCYSENQYAYVCTVEYVNGYGSAVSLYAIAGQEHIALIDSLSAKQITVDFATDGVPEKAFVATSVSAYYLPLISQNDAYTLIDDSNQTLTLSQGTEFTPKYLLEFMGDKYYFAEIDVNGSTVSGYIPLLFTAKVLSEDFKWNEYTVEKVNKTTIYTDQDLSTAITDIADGSSVKIIEKGQSVSRVAVQYNGEWIEGFISNQAIKRDEQTAIRNVLIILAVTACVCTTSIYFILRKKRS